MKTFLITLPILTTLLLPIPAWTDDHDEEEFEENLETVERDVMNFIRKVEPRAVSTMKAWSKEDREEYVDTLFEIQESLMEIEELREEAPAFADLYHRILAAEIKMEYLGIAIQESESPAERNALEAELKALLPKAFEDRMKQAELELAELRSEISEIETEWKKRIANKEKIIERRYRELTGEDEDLDW